MANSPEQLLECLTMHVQYHTLAPALADCFRLSLTRRNVHCVFSYETVQSIAKYTAQSAWQDVSKVATYLFIGQDACFDMDNHCSHYTPWPTLTFSETLLHTQFCLWKCTPRQIMNIPKPTIGQPPLLIYEWNSMRAHVLGTQSLSSPVISQEHKWWREKRILQFHESPFHLMTTMEHSKQEQWIKGGAVD